MSVLFWFIFTILALSVLFLCVFIWRDEYKISQLQKENNTLSSQISQLQTEARQRQVAQFLGFKEP